jgi:hypothetical protein
MGTVLPFRTVARARLGGSEDANRPCEIVIFPGVRIERHDLDLSHRVRDAAGHGGYGGYDAKRRPRTTS